MAFLARDVKYAHEVMQARKVEGTIARARAGSAAARRVVGSGERRSLPFAGRRASERVVMGAPRSSGGLFNTSAERVARRVSAPKPRLALGPGSVGGSPRVRPERVVPDAIIPPGGRPRTSRLPVPVARGGLPAESGVFIPPTGTRARPHGGPTPRALPAGRPRRSRLGGTWTRGTSPIAMPPVKLPASGKTSFMRKIKGKHIAMGLGAAYGVGALTNHGSSGMDQTNGRPTGMYGY